MRSPSLRARLVLLVLLSLAPGLAVLIQAVPQARGVLSREVEQDALQIARFAAREYEHTYRMAAGLVRALAGHPALTGGDAAACGVALHGFLAACPHCTRLGVASVDGKITCSARPATDRPDDDLGTAPFAAEALGKDLFVSTSPRASPLRRSSLVVAAPVRAGKAASAAVVFAELDADSVAVEEAMPHLPRGSTVSVIDLEGTVLARAPRAAPDSDVLPHHRALVARMLSEREGIAEEEGGTGTRRLYAFVALAGVPPGVGRVVAIGISPDVAYSKAERTFRTGVLALVASVLLALLVTWLYARFFIMRPTEALVGAATRLTRGDLTARSGLVHAGDEVGRLAKAFDDMAASLEKMSRRQRLVLEAAGEGVCGFDGEGRITFANPAAATLLGRQGQDLVGLRLYDLMPPASSRGTGTSEWSKVAVAADGGTIRGQDDFRRADGRTIAAQYVLSSIVEDGRVTGAVMVFDDVTEHRRLEDQLRQAQKLEALGRLAGGVAHDFNNILTAIHGFASLLERKVPAGDPRLSEVAEIIKASDRAAALTRQLLAFSRRQVLAPRVLELATVVATEEKMLRRLIGEDIELVILHGPERGLVRADPVQIEQVVLNLVINARDAMPEGGRLLVETGARVLDADSPRGRLGAAPGAYVTLSVTDSGTGMDEETQEHLFEPFFTTKGPGAGTGLGLATVWGIVQQSGGDVAVESAPGRGTTFRVFFPRVAGEDALAVAGRRSESPRGREETVLVVEDDLAVRALVRQTLDAAGFKVLDAADAAQAQATSEAHPGTIHLLLTDLVMPKMNGRQLAARLAPLRPGMKVLYMSGYDDEVGAVPPEKRGRVLQKPFTTEGLLTAVRETLEGRSAA